MKIGFDPRRDSARREGLHRRRGVRHHFTGVSQQCRRFLERCERGDLKGITSAAAMAEASHRPMMMEAVASGLVTAGNVAKKLRAKPGIIKKLHRYRERVEKIPLMRIDVHPLDLKVLLRSADLRPEHGLMVNDSIMVATALAAGFDWVATSERDFRRVGELSIAVSSDLPKA